MAIIRSTWYQFSTVTPMPPTLLTQRTISCAMYIGGRPRLAIAGRQREETKTEKEGYRASVTARLGGDNTGNYKHTRDVFWHMYPHHDLDVVGAVLIYVLLRCDGDFIAGDPKRNPSSS